MPKVTTQYAGMRVGGKCSVVVQRTARKDEALPPRNDVFNHSPDGFEWGYGGSGPGQLSLAILCDLFKVRTIYDRVHEALGDPDVNGGSALALRLHHTFKTVFISAQKGDQWVLLQADAESLAIACALQRKALAKPEEPVEEPAQSESEPETEKQNEDESADAPSSEESP